MEQRDVDPACVERGPPGQAVQAFSVQRAREWLSYTAVEGCDARGTKPARGEHLRIVEVDDSGRRIELEGAEGSDQSIGATKIINGQLMAPEELDGFGHRARGVQRTVESAVLIGRIVPTCALPAPRHV